MNCGGIMPLYSRLKQLIKNRDNYVHNKSRFHEFQGYSKEEYEQIERIKKDADEEYIEYNFSKVSCLYYIEYLMFY